MQLWIVRHKSDQQAVGLIWADSLDEMWWIVDGITDPHLCEYKPVTRRSAIAWEGDAPAIGVSRELDANGTHPDIEKLHSDASFLGAFEGLFWSDMPKGWKPMPSFSEASEE